MRLDTSLYQKMDMRQGMILAPRMIQSMEILQMPVMALEEKVRQELDENPALEIREGEETTDSASEIEIVEEKTPDPDAELVIDDDNELDFNRLDALEQDLDSGLGDDHRPSRNGIEDAGDRKLDAMANMPSRPQSLQDYMSDQAGYLDLEPEEIERIRLLISYIDDRGYLKVPDAGDDPLETLAKTGVATRDQLEDALYMLQHLDPQGVGARDLAECLLLQLTPETKHRELVRTLIQQHWDDISHNRLPQIQKKTGVDIATIKEAIEVIGHLTSKPGAGFNSESAMYVTPDVIIERSDEGDYDIRLVDDWIPDVHIPRSVIELARNRSTDPKAREYIKRKITAATWLIDAIEQRRRTLEKVTRAIITRQKAFLDLGPDHIEPLKMQQIADDVKVHVTTVSRAVDDKWVQTPRGTFPLKRFFGGGTQTASGEEVAWEKIKNKLLELVRNEDKANPLSDEDIMDKLISAGYDVARRTVTKYRKMLKIPSSRQRKDWALPG